jgi:serine/threonine protein kinase/tetratricopeptide (TPR) repeat protein
MCVGFVYLCDGSVIRSRSCQAVSNPADETNSNLEPGPVPGTMVGRYRIVRLIECGGMGEVYEAVDTELSRTIALKLLPPVAATEEDSVSRFLGEARAAAAFNHPNIITVHDIGDCHGRPFFAMEYLTGESLRSRISRGPLSLEETLSIFSQICQGLEAAHGAGLIHRDLTPGNVFIGPTGQVKILDFGLVSVRNTAGQSPKDGCSGTVAYMSPEQLNNEEVTAASDLFSLGVVLYEMLTGRRPFQGEYEASLIYAILNDEPEPLSTYRADIPPELQTIVMRLLQKNTAQRYRQVSDVLADLETFQTPANKRELPHSSRRRWPLWLAAGIIVVAAVAWWYPWTGLRPSPPGKQMLAVLPFSNLGAPEDEYFADGIVDAITTHLARISRLGVISRSSSMEYRNSTQSISRIGAELNCQWLVTGTVRWDRSTTPSRVLVQAGLVDAASDTHVWANSYERSLGDIFELQSEIAADIAGELQLVLRESDRQALAEKPTDNLEAYDFFLRGSQYFNRSWEQQDIDIATGLFQRAVELDTGFALAYAMLSRGHESMYWEYYDHTETRKQAAHQAVLRALELNPELPEGHLALGYYYYHCENEYEKALLEFEATLSRWPNSAEAHSAVAAVQRRIGPMEQAAANFVEAADLDPRSHLKLFDVGLTYGMMRQYRQAGIYLDKVIALAPDWPLAHVYKAWLVIFQNGDVAKAHKILSDGSRHADLARSQYYWWLARIVEPNPQTILDVMKPGADTAVYYVYRAQMNRLLGRHDVEAAYSDSARVLLEERVRNDPDNARYHSHLGLAYTGLGQRDLAFQHGQRAIELLPTTRDAFDALFFLVNFTETCVVFKEYDQAIEQLKYMLTIPGFISPVYLNLDPIWRPLHDQPGWQDLIKSASR